MSGSVRTVFGSGDPELRAMIPEIVQIGWGSFPMAERGHLKAHRHRDAYEFCLILSGEVEWETATVRYVLRAGDAFLTKPDEEHWGRDAAMHPCSLLWLIVKTSGASDRWLGLSRNAEIALCADIDRIEAHLFRSTPALRTAFENLFNEHTLAMEDRLPPPLEEALARSMVVRLIIETVRAARMSPRPTTDAVIQPLCRQLDLLMDKLCEDGVAAANLHDVCASAGVSYDDLNHRIAEALGTSLPQYWLRRRIALSRDALRSSDVPIIDIAHRLGFSSSQHFATAFRKITGLTPSAYRRLSDADRPQDRSGRPKMSRTS